MSKTRTWDRRLLAKIEAIKSWQVAVLIVVLAFACFWTGLSGEFQGDDSFQIVNNPPVHAGDIGQLFGGSTFWDGQSLSGVFYRPMMSVTFAVIYGISGANPTAYHVVQLLLYAACAFVLYLFLKTLLRPVGALGIALVFLVHPVNTQVVYSIPCMQEPLFFLTGISALYVLARSRGTKGLVWAAVLLLLSLLSKETGIVFVGLALVYLWLYQRDRLLSFIKVMIVPLLLYGLLRYHAVGLSHAALQVAPIDQLSLGERLLTIPALLVFYAGKLLWPADLATSYYWVERSVSWQGVILPLLIVLAVVAGATAVGRWLYKKSERPTFWLYVFFTVWTVGAIVPYLQLVPLDMTACETWLFALLPGACGMGVVALSELSPRRLPVGLLMIGVAVVMGIAGVRSAVRGLDYHSQYTLSMRDIDVSPRNYLAMNNLTKAMIDQHDYAQATGFAEQSINFFPSVSNYTNLGVIRQTQRDFIGAKDAYETALHYGTLGITYENLAIVYITAEDPASALEYLHHALTIYPRSPKLLTYLAMQTASMGKYEEAKVTLMSAMHYGQVPAALYRAITTGAPLDIPLANSDKVLHLPGVMR